MITNKAVVKRLALEAAQAALLHVERIGSDLLMDIEVACGETCDKIIRAAIAQHRRASKTLRGPVAGLPAASRRAKQ